MKIPAVRGAFSFFQTRSRCRDVGAFWSTACSDRARAERMIRYASGHKKDDAAMGGGTVGRVAKSCTGAGGGGNLDPCTKIVGDCLWDFVALVLCLSTLRTKEFVPIIRGLAGDGGAVSFRIETAGFTHEASSYRSGAPRRAEGWGSCRMDAPFAPPPTRGDLL
jgi:hypothetical protein